MKQPVIAMQLHPGVCLVNGVKAIIHRPKGCPGILFVFESKKAARDYFGKDIQMVGLEIEKK